MGEGGAPCHRGPTRTSQGASRGTSAGRAVGVGSEAASELVWRGYPSLAAVRKKEFHSKYPFGGPELIFVSLSVVFVYQ